MTTRKNSTRVGLLARLSLFHRRIATSSRITPLTAAPSCRGMIPAATTSLVAAVPATPGTALPVASPALTTLPLVRTICPVALHTRYNLDAFLTGIARQADVAPDALHGRAEVQDLRDLVRAGWLLQQEIQHLQLELAMSGPDDDLLGRMEHRILQLDAVDEGIALVSRRLVHAVTPKRA